MVTHDRFESSEYVLRDDVSLYVITRTHAVFVQRSAEWPTPLFTEDFFQTDQYYSCNKLIYMPLGCFHRLAETIEDDGVKLIFLQSAGRSGSSLLKNIFKETGRCVCFNEPQCLTTLDNQIMTRKIWRGEEAKKVYRNTIRVLCKPYRGLTGSVLAYVIKPAPMASGSMELMTELFPKCYQFFTYRDPAESAISVLRIGQALVSYRLLFQLPNLPRILGIWTRLHGYPDMIMRGYTCAVHQDIELGYRCCIGSMHYYLRSVEHGVNIRGIRYSHLVAEREMMIKKIFQICGLPDELVVKATEALKTDSQKFSPISREILAQLMPVVPKLTPQHLKAARQMADEFDVPRPESWKDKKFYLKNGIVV